MPSNLTSSNSTALFLDAQHNFAALIFGILLIVIIICGNLLVCISVYKENALKTTTNYFIVSLAVADLLLAVLVLPLFVYAQFQNGVWSLNMTICDALMTMDVMLCTASIFNLCAISVDRFIAVAVPFNYNRRHVDQRQVGLLVGTWVVALAVASPVVFGINDVPGRSQRECKLENESYVLYSSVCSFFIPCPLMLLLYCGMFRGLRRWEEARKAKLRGSMQTSQTLQEAAAALTPPLADSLSPLCSPSIQRENLHPAIEREVTLENLHPAIEREVTLENLHSAIEREVTLENLHPAIELEDTLNNLHPTIEREVTLENLHPTIERVVTLENLHPTIERVVTLENQHPGIECEVTHENSHTTIQPALTHENLHPVLECDTAHSALVYELTHKNLHRSTDQEPHTHVNLHPAKLMCVDLSPVQKHTLMELSPVQENTFVELSPLQENTFMELSPVQENTFMELSPVQENTLGEWSLVQENTLVELSPVQENTLGEWSLVQENTLGELSPVQKHTFMELSAVQKHTFMDLKVEKLDQDLKPEPPLAESLRRDSMSQTVPTVAYPNLNRNQQSHGRTRAKINRRERKAMRVLPVVVGAFLFCWTPFFVVHTLRAMCDSCEVPQGLMSTVTWLGYVNSAVNPVIYTVFNTEFRKFFRKFLSCCC